MSTRCQVWIYDTFHDDEPGAMLYHHSDGYPEFMKGKLKRFLKKSFEVLSEAGYLYWWDSERVASVLVMLSVEDYEDPILPNTTNRSNEYVIDKPYRPHHGVPIFQPTVGLHGDEEFLWKVYLTGKDGKFKIKYDKI